MKTDVQKVEKTDVARVGSPADMIKLAVEGGADLEKLSKLLDIQERWEATEARKAYNKAMTDFKANPPKIYKDKEVSFGAGKTAYKHATLGNVCETITAALSKHGLSASWRVSQNGQISVACRISHALGHFEETMLSAPADTSGSKNSIQAIGSTITYLERYTLLALTGLATEEDNDGSGEIEFIDQEQLSAVVDYLASTKSNQEKFLKYMGAESLEKIKKTDYQKAITALKAKEVKK